MSEPKELGQLRREKGWSVEELAERSGVDVEIIRAIERDRWYQEYDAFTYTSEEQEIVRRLMLTLGVVEIVIDKPPSLRPGDIVLGAEALDLLPQEVIEANADKVAIAVPDPETGEVGLIRYERLTPQHLDKIVKYNERRQGAVEEHYGRLRDHLARMQEMGLKDDESWSDYERKRSEGG